MRLCKGGCDRELIAATVWATWSREDREARRPVQARAVGRGLCTACHRRHQYNGTLDDFERVRRDASLVLAEWEHLADPGLSIKANAEALAPRLGMGYEALRAMIGRRARGEVAA